MNADEAAKDPTRDSLKDQFKSLSGVFWISGWLEIIERFSYTGARVVLPLFMVAAIGLGGPELTHDDKGKILAIWAVVQSFVPILSGGFADRYGYKVNVAISTFLKMLGYILMAFCLPLAAFFAGDVSLVDARAQGTDYLYEILYVAAIMVALGTAIFKPGIGGLISSQLTEKNSSIGWSVFYQLVNVGGFFGPLIAAYLRLIEWHWVFIICAAAIALNFIPLFFFKEPKQPDTGEVKPGPMKMLYQSLCGLLEPRLFFYTLSFAGFWLMTFQIFDILPNFIDDWVDSRGLAAMLKNILGGLVPMNSDGNLTQEWMLNFNALLISLGTFMVGYMTRSWQPLRTIIIGIMMAIVATYGLSMNMSGWWIMGCIIFFSLGEMLSGPANSYYIVSIAPLGKKGLYIGFSGFAVGIGQSIGSIIAGRLYQEDGDKVVLAKRYMEQKLGMEHEVIHAMPKQDVLPRLQEMTNLDGFGVRELLWNTYDPYSMWVVFALIGLGSLTVLCIYNHVMKASAVNPEHSFNRKGNLWVQCCLIPMVVTFVYFTHRHFSVPLLLNTLFFSMMLVISFLPKHLRTLSSPQAAAGDGPSAD